MKPFFEKLTDLIELNNSITNKANPIFGKRVPDFSYGELDVMKNNNQFTCGWRSINVSTKNKYGTKVTQPAKVSFANNTPIIVVVLESPHIKEFDKNSNPLRPLVNDYFFYRYFPSAVEKSPILSSQLQTKTYLVYLMNAIQLQCSLGVPTKIFRDIVFLRHWDIEKVNFISRLTGLNNVEAVINLCTKGNHTMFPNCLYFQSQNILPKTWNNTYLEQLGINKPNAGDRNSLQAFVEEEIIQNFINVSNNSNGSGILYTTGKHPSSWNQLKNKNLIY